MQDVWWTLFPDLMQGRPGTYEQRRELEDWDRRLTIAYRHIQRFFKATGSLPIAGDLLQILDDGVDAAYPNLYIKSRIIRTSPIDEKVRIIYQVQGEYTERMESCSVESAHGLTLRWVI